jgi:hypothetical protein
VEEDRVAGIEDEGNRREQRRLAPEEPGSEKPGEDRSCIEQRDGDLGEGAAGELEQAADDE